MSTRPSPSPCTYSPDGRLVAWLDSCCYPAYFVTVIDLPSDRKTTIQLPSHPQWQFAYKQSPRFSPDGRWLIFESNYQDTPAMLVEVGTGRHSLLPPGAPGGPLCWWVRDGHLGLLSFGDFQREPRDRYAIDFYDLTTLERTPITRLLPLDPALTPEWRQGITDPVPRADGKILVGHAYGPPQTYFEKNSGRQRVATVDLHTGEMTPLASPWIDEAHLIERSQSGWSWNQQLDLAPATDINSVILGNLVAPPTGVLPDADEYVWGGLIRVEFDSPFITGRW